LEKIKPKHSIFDSAAFQKGREQLGKLISKDMEVTGGTDVDWLIERKGGFIILELKEFHNDHITISVGQMIAFQKLHERLNSGGKCYFLIVGSDDIDFKNSNSSIWLFEMNEWDNKSIPHNKSPTRKWYIIERKHMREISLKKFRNMIESFWKEFEQ